jgi:hypothetical protein
MNKWDTIQSDVADMYVGIEEKLNWEQVIADDPDYFKSDNDDLTLDWLD